MAILGIGEAPRIGIIGAGSCDATVAALAEETGYLVAKSGALLYCGGLGGVMEASCRGALKAGGITVGIVPTDRAEDANRYVKIPVATGLGGPQSGHHPIFPGTHSHIGGLWHPFRDRLCP
jgi:uncharacterized protein (TIGR00725 family)